MKVSPTLAVKILLTPGLRFRPGTWMHAYKAEFDALSLVPKPFSNVSRR